MTCSRVSPSSDSVSTVYTCEAGLYPKSASSIVEWAMPCTSSATGRSL